MLLADDREAPLSRSSSNFLEFIFSGVEQDPRLPQMASAATRRVAVAARFAQPQFESEAQIGVTILRRVGRHLAGAA